MRPQSDSRLSHGQHGFTLIEVLAAFAIMSLALVVLFGSVSDSARNAAHVERKTEALHIAQARLAMAGHEQPLRPGTQQGEAEGGYRWTMTVSPYRRQAEAAPQRLAAYWVALAVSHRSGQEEPRELVTLRTLKLAPRQ